MTDVGMRIAGWYLKHIVPKIEPALSNLSRGRLTSLPISPIVFLETVGARSGRPYVSPLTYFTVGEDVILVASNYGLRSNPGWYHNLKARPEVTLRAGGTSRRYIARVTSGQEREDLWDAATRWTPPLARYQQMAGERTVPVIRCTPLATKEAHM